MRSVVCFRELKDAALLFDRVLPVALKRVQGTGTDIVFDFSDRVPSRALLSLVYDDPKLTAQKYPPELWKILDGWELFSEHVTRYGKSCKLSSIGNDYQDLYHSYLSNASLNGSDLIRSHFKKYAQSLGINNADILLPSVIESNVSDQQDPVITLTGIELINATTASWEQIIEIRSDLEARLKLQRLRAFLTKNYLGKTRTYIEDDLARALADYDQARRKHGFDTVVSSISVLLDSGNLQAAIAAGIGAALFGGPWVGLSSAVAVEVGKAAIEVSKRRRAVIDWKASHELAYIIELRPAHI